MPRQITFKLFAVVFVTTLMGVAAVSHFVEYLGYRAERGRLTALRDVLLDTHNPIAGQQSQLVVQAVAPAVVSIFADYAMPVVAQASEGGHAASEASTAPLTSAQAPESNPPHRYADHRQGIGSGFIFNADQGYVLTNSHVVEGAERVLVVLADGRETQATVLGQDPDSDLAVLKIGLGRLHALSFVDGPPAEVGEEILVLGNPFGLSGTVSKGIISAVNRRQVKVNGNEYDSLLQTDAQILPGSSGGPVVNMRGEVVGISTAVASDRRRGEGIGFAIPVAGVVPVLDGLIAGGPAFLGVVVGSVRDFPEEIQAIGFSGTGGSLILSIMPGRAAQVAGLEMHDVILAVDDAPTPDKEALGRIVDRHPPGTEVRVRIWRDGTERVMPLRLGRRFEPT